MAGRLKVLAFLLLTSVLGIVSAKPSSRPSLLKPSSLPSSTSSPKVYLPSPILPSDAPEGRPQPLKPPRISKPAPEEGPQDEGPPPPFEARNRDDTDDFDFISDLSNFHDKPIARDDISLNSDVNIHRPHSSFESMPVLNENIPAPSRFIKRVVKRKTNPSSKPYVNSEARYVRTSPYGDYGFGKNFSPYFGKEGYFTGPYFQGLKPRGLYDYAGAIPEYDPIPESEPEPGIGGYYNSPSLVYGVPHPPSPAAGGPLINNLTPHAGTPKKINVNSVALELDVDPFKEVPLKVPDLLGHPNHFDTDFNIDVSDTLFRDVAERIPKVSIATRRKG